jgi:hypothetical protein
MYTENFEGSQQNEFENNDDETITTLNESVNVSNIEDNNSIMSFGKKQIRHLNISSSRSKDCYKTDLLKIKKKVKYVNKQGKIKYKYKELPIYFYETSSTPGSTIRDAITGHYYDGYHVGKKYDENMYYKTAYCVGDALKPNQKKGENREPQFLYFVNPESYERHFNVSLTTQRKEKWLNDNIEARNNLKIRENKTPVNKTYTIVK